MQFGPTMRSRCGRAARRMRLRQRALSSPEPAVMTTATRVPRSPSSSTRRGTVSGGVMMTARSAGCFSSARLFSTGRPAISPPLMLTRWMSPWKPPASRLRVTASPSEPGRALAPIATTERGVIILSRLRVDIASVPSPTIEAQPWQRIVTRTRPTPSQSSCVSIASRDCTIRSTPLLSTRRSWRPRRTTTSSARPRMPAVRYGWSSCCPTRSWRDPRPGRCPSPSAITSSFGATASGGCCAACGGADAWRC